MKDIKNYLFKAECSNCDIGAEDAKRELLPD